MTIPHVEEHTVSYTLTAACKTKLDFDRASNSYTLTIQGMVGVDNIRRLAPFRGKFTRPITFSETFSSGDYANAVKARWDAAIAELNKPGHP